MTSWLRAGLLTAEVAEDAEAGKERQSIRGPEAGSKGHGSEIEVTMVRREGRETQAFCELIVTQVSPGRAKGLEVRE